MNIGVGGVGRNSIMVRSWCLPAEDRELGGAGFEHLLHGYPAFGVIGAPAVADAELSLLEIVSDNHADVAATAAKFEGFEIEVGFFGFESGAEGVVVVGNGLKAGRAPEAPHDGESVVDLFGDFFDVHIAFEVDEVASICGE